MVRFPMMIGAISYYIRQFGRTFPLTERALVVHLQHMTLINGATCPLASILIPL
jgi:hypothetical protein